MIPPSVPATLQRLSPHLRSGATAVTGGLAIHLHLSRDGGRLARPILDVDLVATDIDGVLPSAVDDFLVSHYHTPHEGYSKFLVQLVDHLTRLRVDIFPGGRGAIQRAARLSLGGMTVAVLASGDVLAHKLEILGRSTPGRPVDPKHYRDAGILAQLLGRRLPEISEDHLTQDRYETDPTIACHRCAASRNAGFTLAPKAAILDVMGYV